MRSSVRPAKAGLITLQTGVIMAIGCVIGAGAGTLTYLGSHSLPQALLTAGAATGGSVSWLRQIVGTGPQRTISGQEDDQHDDQGDGARHQRQA